MLLTPERLYLEVGRLIAEMPELASGAITSKVQRWLVTATEVLRSSGSLKEALQLDQFRQPPEYFFSRACCFCFLSAAEAGHIIR